VASKIDTITSWDKLNEEFGLQGLKDDHYDVFWRLHSQIKPEVNEYNYKHSKKSSVMDAQGHFALKERNLTPAQALWELKHVKSITDGIKKLAGTWVREQSTDVRDSTGKPKKPRKDKKLTQG
jgi:hypothetical protein